MSYLKLQHLWQGGLAIVCCVLAVLARYARASRRPREFPPGPSPWPVIGNLHQLPLKKSYLRFHEWSKQFGPIVGLKLGPQNVVVLNSYTAVRDLFEKRGGIYSSRPASYVGNELICPGETHILLVPYGKGWRALRKAVQGLLNVSSVDELLPVQDAEASQTLYQLLDDPAHGFNHIRRYSAAVILASVFGLRGASYEDPRVQALYHAQEQFTEILAPGATPPVDVFPILRFMPTAWAPWKRWAERIRHEQQGLYKSLLNKTRENRQKSDRIPCFMEKLVDLGDKSGLNEEQIAQTGGILMEAGSDTTAATLHSFILAMIAYPTVLKKIQQEVDAVCGTARAPCSRDILHLPYTEAVMTETLRWRPVSPGGIPHLLTQDDWYGGYFLPKDTIVFLNTWSINQDDAEYDDPQHFNPDRYLVNKFGSKAKREDGGTNDDPHRRVTYTFGAGRRVCPGQRLAENSLMVNMAKIAWAFDIAADPAAPPDWSLETGYSDGFVCGPKPFTAVFTARSDQHRDVIEREYQEAKYFFQRYQD